MKESNRQLEKAEKEIPKEKKGGKMKYFIGWEKTGSKGKHNQRKKERIRCKEIKRNQKKKDKLKAWGEQRGNQKKKRTVKVPDDEIKGQRTVDREHRVKHSHVHE